MGKIENIAPPHGQMPWQNYRMKKLLSHIESNHRNPSKHRLEEHAMLNWVKANRKRMNAGEMKEPRLGMFKELLALSDQYRRKNQYE